jgi:NAD(P)-dependent dehydrogenase (short-subunit alcohol dehydrogenase family)
MSNKIWFITGSSRGFGRIWAEAALKRGDKVAATARTLASVADLNDKYGANVLTSEDSISFSITPAIPLSARLRKPAQTTFEVSTIRTSSAHSQSFKRRCRCSESRVEVTSSVHRADLDT